MNTTRRRFFSFLTGTLAAAAVAFKAKPASAQALNLNWYPETIPARPFPSPGMMRPEITINKVLDRFDSVMDTQRLFDELRDAQQMYNWALSQQVELLSLSPKAPYTVETVSEMSSRLPLIIEEARKQLEGDPVTFRQTLLAKEQINFIMGDQWPENIRQMRTADGRPTLTINKMRSKVRLVP